MIRKIAYLTGSRADFGLMQSTLQAINITEELALSIIVTGSHLSERYGFTVVDIETAKLPITCRIPIELDEPSGASMAKNIGRMTIGLVDALQVHRPDVLLLLGDRGEMLAGAIAAIHLNIPIAHVHGGELSGTIDEPIRHSISKLAHFHFVATAAARDRLIRMGEASKNIYVTGAPGLDGLAELVTHERDSLFRNYGLVVDCPVGIMIYHPTLQDSTAAAEEARNILSAMVRKRIQVVALRPNSDSGSLDIDRVLDTYERAHGVKTAAHFPRHVFASWMAAADFMIGNSSAGIIEAATFGLPVINVGSRQRFRERNANVSDVEPGQASIERAISHALSAGRYAPRNIYGDGQAGPRIVSLLKEVSLTTSTLAKINAY